MVVVESGCGGDDALLGETDFGNDNILPPHPQFHSNQFSFSTALLFPHPLTSHRQYIHAKARREPEAHQRVQTNHEPFRPTRSHLIAIRPVKTCHVSIPTLPPVVLSINSLQSISVHALSR
ncbi:hypothetical protein BaRGS_00002199 [Batillaria attramentaria]|uniref:Uncharacterized protein n=1 Tax=Batillaria attramentaria TaxID=370345 RepID=A0ABD0M5P6_9CAEN